MEYKVFYSWQSDLPNATNRGFIQNALERAAKAVSADDTVEVDPVVDRDTAGVPGSPEIASTIFDKIEEDEVFVADVSIINAQTESRPTPNPNVILELGYAAKHLGWSKVVMVFNTAYGKIEDLPFDLRMRRVIPYHAIEGENDRSAEKKKLGATLEEALRSIIANKTPTVGETITPPSLLQEAIEAVEQQRPNQVQAVRRYMKSLVERVAALNPKWDAKGVEPDDLLITAIKDSEHLVVEFATLAEAVATTDSEPAAREIFDRFNDIVTGYDLPRGFSGTFGSHWFDFYKFLGNELFVTFIAKLIGEGRWKLVSSLLEESFYPDNAAADKGSRAKHWSFVASHVRLLRHRNDRLKQNRISIHADLLHQRHTDGAIARAVPFDQYVSADVYLGLRSELEGDGSNSHPIWYPVSCLYLHEAPRFLLRAERRTVAEAVTAGTGFTPEEARDRIAAFIQKLRKTQDIFSDMSFGSYDPQSFGSR